MLRLFPRCCDFKLFITRAFLSEIRILSRTGETLENLEKKKWPKLESWNGGVLEWRVWNVEAWNPAKRRGDWNDGIRSAVPLLLVLSRRFACRNSVNSED
jgi:hypothetical protein